MSELSVQKVTGVTEFNIDDPLTLTSGLIISSNTSNDAVRITQIGSGNALVVEDSANPDGTPFVVDANGNVGIGTSIVSGYALAANGRVYIGNNTDMTPDANWSGQLTIDGNGYAAGLAADATGMWIGHNSSVVSVLFATNETERVRITGAGNVGIGTSSPTQKLDVNGTVNATSFTGDGSSLTGIAAFPAGTKMLFIQTAAPTGWTKDTTHDNKALRIVSGSASSGGTVAFTTAFASKAVSGTVGGTTLTTTQIPSHRHYVLSTGGYNGLGEPSASTFMRSSMGYGDVGPDYNAGASNSDATVGLSSASGSSGSHTHSFSGTAIDLAVQYVDAIIATKN